VETTDVITPLVDDPFTFGRIAAANAISDVYAMGGRPVTAMNLVFFPACSLGGAVLAEILRGGQAAMEEAGVCLVGGHTVDDEQLKYGLAVTGLIDPGAVIRNNTPRPGDRLLLTKPLGSGIIATAIKGESVAASLVAEAVSWMTALNRTAAELMVACGASAATDVTGFGLLGHACEMAGGGEVSLRIGLESVPLMAGVPELIGEGMVPAGCYRNRDHYAARVSPGALSGDPLLPLFDPQTSGGLLIALPPQGAAEYLRLAGERSQFAVEIGQVIPRTERAIVIT
jgi:selenide,water dikinase